MGRFAVCDHGISRPYSLVFLIDSTRANGEHRDQTPSLSTVCLCPTKRTLVLYGLNKCNFRKLKEMVCYVMIMLWRVHYTRGGIFLL